MQILKNTDVNVQVSVDHAIFPIETTDKGLKSFTVDMDNLELDETGTKEINGKVVFFYKFKIIK